MPKVIVIGAGAAGLAVAKKLSHECGYTIVILEALDRIGGRVKCCDMGGQRIDIGASWMHETRENPLFKEGLTRNWPMRYTDNGGGLYTDKGKAFQGIAPIIQDLQWQIEEYCMMNESTSNHISFKQFATASIEAMPLLTPSEKGQALKLCREIEHFVGMPWDQIPVGDGLLTTPQGRDAFMLGKGYSQVIEWLWQHIDHSRVSLQLDEEVTYVSHNKVNTTKGEYEADYVVCTIPLGALKNSISIFETLPRGIVQTINQTNMAALGKVVVEFPHSFWDTDRDSFFVSRGETEFVTIVCPFNKPILIVLTGPPLTNIVESDPDNGYDHIEWALHLIGGPVPKPKKVVVSDWTQSRFFAGSYSARSLGQSYDDLVMPFIEGAGNLRFAGEHTVFDGNGCVHGAYKSGLREADAILHLEKGEILI